MKDRILNQLGLAGPQKCGRGGGGGGGGIGFI